MNNEQMIKQLNKGARFYVPIRWAKGKALIGHYTSVSDPDYHFKGIYEWLTSNQVDQARMYIASI